MSSARQLSSSDEFLLNEIIVIKKDTPRITPDRIKAIVTPNASDPLFIATLCARALQKTVGEHCQEILQTIYSVLTADQISKVYKEVRNILATTLDLLFMDHKDDAYPEAIRLILNCGISKPALEKAIQDYAREEKSYPKPEIFKEVGAATCSMYKETKDFSLLNVLATHIIPGNEHEYGRALLNAVSSETTDKQQRMVTIKKLIEATASYKWAFGDKLNIDTFKIAIEFKDDFTIEWMIFGAKTPLQRKLIAEGVAYAITDDNLSSTCGAVIKAINKHLNREYKNKGFIDDLREALKDKTAQVNKTFLANINNPPSNEVVALLLQIGVSLETHIKTIETSTNVDTALACLDQFLEQKPAAAELKKITKLFWHGKANWRIAEKIALNPVKGYEDVYGDLLLSAARHGQKELLKKLLHANPTMIWLFDKKYVLHYLVDQKWNDVIAEMLTSPEGIKLLASGVATLLKNTQAADYLYVIAEINKEGREKNKQAGNRDVSTAFYDALHDSLTKEDANSAFIRHIHDAKWPVLDMLIEYGVEVDSIIKACEMTKYPNNDIPIYLSRLLELKFESQLAKIMDLVIKTSMDLKDWSSLDKLVSKSIERGVGTEELYGKALVNVARHAPQRLDIIKKLIDAKASLTYKLDGGFTILHCIVYHNNYGSLVFLLKDASPQQVAKWVIQMLSDNNPDLVKNYQQFVGAINNLFITPKNADLFYKELEKVFPTNRANELFLKYMNEKLPHAVLDMVERYIDADTHIKAIDTCNDIKTAEIYLEKFLAKKPMSAKLAEAVKKVIARCEKSNNWSLANGLIKNIFPGNQAIYGELLLALAKFDQIEMVRQLIKSNPSCEEISVDALIQALATDVRSSDHPKYLDELLEHKLDVKQLEKMVDIAITLLPKNDNYLYLIASKPSGAEGNEIVYGKALLHAATENTKNTFGIIRKLIEAKASLDYSSKDSQDTALHRAIQKRNYVVASMLVEAGANLNAINAQGKTPEALALLQGDYYQAALLRKDQSNREKIKAQKINFSQRGVDQLNTLYRIFQNDDTSLQCILDEDAVCIAAKTSKESALVRKQIARVIFNIISECKTEDEKVLANKIECITLLLHNNIFAMTLEELKNLVIHYRDDKTGNTLLHIAVECGQFNTVKWLLKAGANPDQINNAGTIPLFIAEKKGNLSIARLLKLTQPHEREEFLRVVEFSGLKTVEEELKRTDKTRTAYKASTGDHDAIEDMIKSCKRKKHFGKMLITAARGFMDSQSISKQSSYQAVIEELTIENLSYCTDWGITLSDKIKLTHLKDFLLNHLNDLRGARQQARELNLDLDPHKLILLVMKQTLIKPELDDITAKEKIESSLRSIMQKEWKKTEEEVDREMDYNHFIVDKLLGLKQPEPEIKAGETVRHRLRSALTGDARALRRMVALYHKDTEESEIAKFKLPGFRNLVVPRLGRLMLFCSSAAPFVVESDCATFKFYIMKLDPNKTMSHSAEKKRILNLMKDFYLYTFTVSKHLTENYTVASPYFFQFLALEHASQCKKYSKVEIRTIRERLKKSMKSAMLKQGEYDTDECRIFINTKEKEVEDLGQLKLFVEEQATQTISPPLAQPVRQVVPSAPAAVLTQAVSPPPYYTATYVTSSVSEQKDQHLYPVLNENNSETMANVTTTSSATVLQAIPVTQSSLQSTTASTLMQLRAAQPVLPPQAMMPPVEAVVQPLSAVPPPVAQVSSSTTTSSVASLTKSSASFYGRSQFEVLEDLHNSSEEESEEENTQKKRNHRATRLAVVV